MAGLGSVAPANVFKNPAKGGTPAVSRGLLALGQGLASMSVAYEQVSNSEDQLIESNNTLALANRDRERGLVRSQKMVEFSKLQGQWARDSIELEKNADPTGIGYTAQAEEELNKRLDSFLATVPDYLQNEYRPIVETYRQNEINTAFGQELGLQGRNFANGLLDLQTQAIDSIFLKQRTAKDWEVVIDDYLSNSPFSKEDTEKMRREARKAIQTMDAQTRAAEEAASPEGAGMDVGSWPAGLPPEAVGLLGTLIQYESGGKANVIYGGGTFSDYSQHPNVPVVIQEGPHKGETSTAAGLVQFLKSTWDDISAELGLTDFSPANQIRAGWALAQKDYNRKTGRDLLSDLRSGDPALIETARQALLGTWPSLHVFDDNPAAFAERVLSGKGIPSSIMTDPNYTELSVVERSQIMLDAQTKAAEDQKKALAAETAARTKAMSDFLLQIANGQVGSRAEIEGFSEQYNLPLEDREKLFAAREKYQGDVVTSENFFQNLNKPGHVFGPEDQKGFDLTFAQEGAAAFQAGDYGYLQGTFIPMVQRTGMIPQAALDQILNMTASNSPAAAQFAYDAMLALEENANTIFASKFTQDQRSDAIYYRNLAPYLPETQRLEEIAARRSPEFTQAKAALEPIMRDEIKNNVGDFNPTALADALGGVVDSPAQGMALMRQAQTLYEREFYRYGNHKQAYAATLEMLKTEWGTFDSGNGAYLMQKPPQLAGATDINGSYDWINNVARADMGLAPEDNFRLMSDLQTEVDAQTTGAPSYIVAKEVLPGMFLPILGEDNLPKRTGLIPAKETAKVSVDNAIWFREKKAVDDAFYRFIPNIFLEGPEDMPIEERLSTYLEPKEKALVKVLSAANAELMKKNPQYGSYRVDPQKDLFTSYNIPAGDIEDSLKLLGFSSLEEFRQKFPLMDPNELVRQ